MPLVYEELRRLARSYLRRERPDHTLQATALVHEAYLRLIDQHSVSWQNRAHFFGIASQMMRRILVNHALARAAAKRGGPAEKLSLDEALGVADQRDVDLIALDQALKQLEALDPIAAARIEPGNSRRIVRALEVIRLTGAPFSRSGPGMQTYGEPVFPVSIVGISLPKDVLDRRIDERLAAMRDAGFVDEVLALARKGVLSRTARQAIGYQELLAYVDGSQPSLDAAFDQSARRTKRFARRQLRWFRRDPRITWLEAGHNPCEVLPSLLALWSR